MYLFVVVLDYRNYVDSRNDVDMLGIGEYRVQIDFLGL